MEGSPQIPKAPKPTSIAAVHTSSLDRLTSLQSESEADLLASFETLYTSGPVEFLDKKKLAQQKLPVPKPPTQPARRSTDEPLKPPGHGLPAPIMELIEDWKRDLEMSGAMPSRHASRLPVATWQSPCEEDEDVEANVEVLDEGEQTGRLFTCLDDDSPALFAENFLGDEVMDDGGFLELGHGTSSTRDHVASGHPGVGQSGGSGTSLPRTDSQQEVEWEEAVENFSLDPDFDYEKCPRTAPPDLAQLAEDYARRRANGEAPSLDLSAKPVAFP
mmetsp:Transcript_15777/g.36615  ORF Transcript_15777/g.36615 Transcript_15777/m.36615 type:complete len:274 (-) Transcript_15777:343-1164(-)